MASVMNRKIYLLLLVCVLALTGCSKENAADKAESTEPPQFVVVQHILIGFQGTIPGKPITRSREEAQKLAEDILKRAQSGEDFDALVKQYTDDQHPGVYKMANFGVPPDQSQQIYPRDQMVKGFGDVSFELAVDGIGMAAYDPQASVFGWHIIKRIE